MDNYNILRKNQVWDIVKNKIIVHYYLLSKTEDNKGLKVVNDSVEKMSGKRFKENLNSFINKGVKVTATIVNSQPEKFQINNVYILANGKKAWIYTQEE